MPKFDVALPWSTSASAGAARSVQVADSVTRAEVTPSDAARATLSVRAHAATRPARQMSRLLAYGLALRILRDSALAEDVLQEAFLQLWRSAARFDGRRGTAGSWIMTIVHRRAVDLVRRAEHERRCVAEASESRDPRAGSAEEEASLRERRRGVRTALERLPVDQRALIELAYFEGLTQSELAARLDIPFGTVKSRTFMGLSRLRDLLADGDVADPGSRGVLARAV